MDTRAVLRKIVHPQTGFGAGRAQLNEAAQILNELVEILDPRPPQPLRW
jgi:hypothetical protein